MKAEGRRFELCHLVVCLQEPRQLHSLNYISYFNEDVELLCKSKDKKGYTLKEFQILFYGPLLPHATALTVIEERRMK